MVEKAFVIFCVERKVRKSLTIAMDMKEIIESQRFNNHRIATAIHDAGSHNMVIFCHGFRGTNIGPHRLFVRVARELAGQGISSLRFDQYGSGNSEGDFFDSSFKDWIETARAIAQHYLSQGYKVALVGQSMGGAAVIAVASEVPALTSVVAWAPDPNVDDFISSENGVVEENGQIIQAQFWQEAHKAKIADKLRLVKVPMYIVQCTADEYVDQQNREAISTNAQPHHRVENFEGYRHSSWTFKESQGIIGKSVDFLVKSFQE
ncbi:MAG: alpha/beta fold hydrolase [Parcubacteria group bacterium]|nr:alpha/beta fold hydrolase [Parcubacteria group bacterium]